MRTVAIALLIGLTLISCGTGGTSIRPSLLQERAGTYANPMRITVADGSLAESCPDPSIIRGQSAGDNNWYLYCTSEMFTDHSRLHYMAMSKSADLVNWTYVGDVFAGRPSWVATDGYLWAPDIEYFNGKYYLYYAASNTRAGGAAIFVATSNTPTGPWAASETPVVEPEPVPGRGMRSTIDPAIVQDGDQKYIFYGSFNGGISARTLSADGMTSDRGSQVQIALSDRYEAPYIVKRNGYFYLFVSAGTCCDGPLSGYGVYVGRSPNVLGPYVDKDGNSLLESRIGGTPVLTMNGNRWIGPGHNAVATDVKGTDWIIYHAIDAAKPYFNGSWTRRPAILDQIMWIDGWPRVRGGAGPSDSLQVAPVMTFGTPSDTSTAVVAPLDQPGAINASLSDEFDGDQLSAQWSWIRSPVDASIGVGGGTFQFHSQVGDIYQGDHSASILTEAIPSGDYMVEVKLVSSVPTTGVLNFVQGGILIYKNDFNFVKLDSVAINNTRQIEFAKQYVPGTVPRYGSTYLASPADVTYLRIVKRTSTTGQELYSSYSSHDGANWERGGTWTHNLGPGAKIGLISMGGSGYVNYFGYVHVYALAN
jgi:arabinan endo-1,5-alpha-L-arabinosidase